MTWPMQGETAPIARLTDIVTPMAMRVAATLRLADLLSDGARTPAALAEKAGADPIALERLLRYLAVREVFRESAPGTFELTEVGEWLRDDHPNGVRAWLDLSGAMGHADRAFSALLHSIQTGEPAYGQLHGRGFWEELAHKPELTTSFDALMSSGRTGAPFAAIEAVDWTGVRHVVDVGGGDGALLIRLLSAQPQLRGTVVDLAETVTTATARIAEAGLRDRLDAQVGSFFEPLPEHGDVYVLSSILHDWNDADAARILGRCAAAAGQGNRVLIGDQVGTGEEDQHVFTHLDLRMLVYFGGRERTVEGFRELTASVGLEIDRVTNAGGKSVVECVVR